MCNPQTINPLPSKYSLKSLIYPRLIHLLCSSKTLHLLSLNRQVLEGFGGVPPIRPLETLHNALSLKHIDGFLEKMITVPLFKTPASSPPTPIQIPQTLPDKIETLASKFEAEYL